MVRASACTTGATSVTVPTTVTRAAMRARSRWRVTWSRMMSVCSRTLAASGSSPRAAASLTITESGVFSACARLPTCVRARSTISRLASISALVSRASGAISTGKLPSSRSAVPARIAARLAEMRLSGARPNRTWNIVVSSRMSASTAKVTASARSKARISSSISAASPATATRKAALLAEIDGALDQAQVLVLRARAHSRSACRPLAAALRHRQARQAAVPERARGAHFGLCRRRAA